MCRRRWKNIVWPHSVQANEIIEVGLEEGRKLYPQLKKLADSLNALYGDTAVKKKKCRMSIVLEFLPMK